jgi:hypothetical protein
MHASRKIFVLILFITFCQFFKSCESGSYRGLYETEWESVWAKVDSIHIPSEIKSTIPFAMEFFGTIGNNGCCRDCGYIVGSPNNNDFILKIYGNYKLQDKNCSGMMDCSIKMAFPSPGIYTLKIKQPDSTFLVKQITVN